MEKKYLHSDLTGQIIKAYYKVYNTLGYGFLEKVYEKAMIIELRNQGIHAESQTNIKVFYEQEEVGDYYSDIIVEGKVIVELKACVCLTTKHQAQLVNYLKATEVEVGLLLNFGESPEFRRRLFTNDRKRWIR